MDCEWEESGEIRCESFGFSADVIHGTPKPGMFAHFVTKEGVAISLEILRVEYPHESKGDTSAVELVLDTGSIQDQKALKFLYDLRINDQVISITKKPNV